MNFKQKLANVVKKNSSLLCIGLDSDFAKLPNQSKRTEQPQFAFNKAIIDATHNLVCAYKPNSAFYEARGAEGLTELKMTCDYLRRKYPDIVVILDAKRADIGSTNEGYVHFAFDYLGVDAITLHPYLGKEALQPFLNREEKSCFILCRTSNPGAGELQDLQTGTKPLYQIVAEKVAKEWNGNANCGLVVGATYPKELAIVRRLVGEIVLLVPGIGAQGGDLEKSIRFGKTNAGDGLIINASRSVIFASTDGSFVRKARQEAFTLREEINKSR